MSGNEKRGGWASASFRKAMDGIFERTFASMAEARDESPAGSVIVRQDTEEAWLVIDREMIPLPHAALRPDGLENALRNVLASRLTSDFGAMREVARNIGGKWGLAVETFHSGGSVELSHDKREIASVSMDADGYASEISIPRGLEAQALSALIRLEVLRCEAAREIAAKIRRETARHERDRISAMAEEVENDLPGLG